MDKHQGYHLCNIFRAIPKVNEEELRKMDQKTRKLMTMHKTLPLRDNTDRLCVKKKEEDMSALKIASIHRYNYSKTI